MDIGTLVWCTITATISIMGTPVKDHETAALGRVRYVFGTSLIVDFSEYAKKQKYIGEYNSITVEDFMCTKEEK